MHDTPELHAAAQEAIAVANELRTKQQQHNWEIQSLKEEHADAMASAAAAKDKAAEVHVQAAVAAAQGMRPL